MSIRDRVPRRWGGLRRWGSTEDRPVQGFEAQMEALHSEMDRLFDDIWSGSGARGLIPETGSRFEFLPQIDESEDDKAYYVNVDLPGMDEKDVEVTVSNRVLTIRGEKQVEDEEKAKDVYRRERSYGSFRRVIQLPGEVDEAEIDAAFKKGVLRITLPKSKEAREKIKKIPVREA